MIERIEIFSPVDGSVYVDRPVRYGGEFGGFEKRLKWCVENATVAFEPIEFTDQPGFRRYIKRQPVGVVFVIAPWNYPYLTAFNTIVPALLSGSVVIHKAASQTLLVGECFQQAFNNAGVPAGLFQNLVLSHRQSERMIADNPVDHVNFTGSVSGGRAIEKAVAGTFTTLGFELGGKDPVFVHADAEVGHAVENLVDGAFYNSGQCCCGIERIYVHEKVFKEFVGVFVDLTRKYVLGDPFDEATTLGPMANAKGADFVREQVQAATRSGAKAHIDARDFDRSVAANPYCAPQVLTKVNHQMREESFGPVIGIMKVADDEEAIRLMNDSLYGLTASIWTGDADVAASIGERVETGTVYMNRCDYLDPALAWTGVKNTGRGASLSQIGLTPRWRPNGSHRTWAVRSARPMARRKAPPGTGISATCAVTPCSSLTGLAASNAVHCAPAMFTAPMAGKMCSSRCWRDMRFFRADAAFAVPELYKTPEAEGCSYAIRPGKAAVPESRIASCAQAPRGSPADPCAAHLRRLRVSGRVMGQIMAGRRRGRTASWRVVAEVPNGIPKIGFPKTRLPKDRLRGHQPADGAGPDHSVLQPARHRRTACRGRKEGDQSDASFLQGHGAERGAASASCIGLQSRCLAAGRRPACGPVSSGSERGSSATPEPSRSNRPGRLSAALCSPRILAAIQRLRAPPVPASGTCMTVSAIKPWRKRLDGSDPTGAGQTEFRFKPVAAAINRARFTNRMPEPRHSPPKRLDPYAKQRQHDRNGVLIGGCGGNTYGPRMKVDDGRVVSTFIVQALRGEPITILGDDSQTCSFCYIDDMVAALLRLMVADASCTGPINLGDANEFTIRELADRVRSLTRSSSKIEYQSLPDDDPRQRQPDTTMARQVLDWERKVSLDEGLKETVNYFKVTLGTSTATRLFQGSSGNCRN